MNPRADVMPVTVAAPTRPNAGDSVLPARERDGPYWGGAEVGADGTVEHTSPTLECAMSRLSRKLKIKLAVVAALTALIAGAMLATGPDSPAGGRHPAGSVR